MIKFRFQNGKDYLNHSGEPRVIIGVIIRERKEIREREVDKIYTAG